MGKIILLDNALANMIAAGEVIERPSSVVKELVENSLDAQSRRIDIAVYDGGRAKIVVTDDGEGMDRDDAVMALKRHATSKIKTEFDLFRIKTLGFRGEALPSIASVSQLDLTTATGRGSGTRIHAHEDGLEVEDASSKRGTSIAVSELFYNTPARLKHLKSDYIENAATNEIVSRLALGHPHVAMSLSIDDREQFVTSGLGKQLEAIMRIYGPEAAKHMVSVRYACPDFSLSGYVGQPSIAKSNRYYIITLLNGRSVYMPKIQTSIIEAYKDFLPPVRFPFVVMNFDIDPALVDVNVHPSKREIRFTKEDALKEALLKVIPEALRETPLMGQPLTHAIKTDQTRDVVLPDEVMSLLETDEPITKSDINVTDKPIATKKIPNLRVIGQLHNTYLVTADSEGGFVLIDQHAAAERINYERFQALALTDAYKTTPLVPLVITFKPSEETLFTSEKKRLLEQTGVVLEPFGIHTYKVTEIPLWAREEDERSYVEQLIDQIIHQHHTDPLAIRDAAIASKSCKRSLKANQALSLEEMQRLLSELLATSNPYACPHGRPTMIAFSKYDLEKMFNRTGF
ncbi:MAG: DNA mismatch repair endonuclease MutL [Bacilli bacterium]|jgi:DNA mismatch repair protein MutL